MFDENTDKENEELIPPSEAEASNVVPDKIDETPKR